jgi:hypothetical protein
VPRDISTALQTAFSSQYFNPVLFVELTFSNETIYVWSGIGSTSWNGQTWAGVGGLLGISTPEDSSVVEAKGITVSLSGIDATLLPEALNEIQLGLPVIVYLGALSGGTPIATPVIAWSGRIDQPTFTIGRTDVSLDIACESRLVDVNVSVERRLSNADTQSLFPGDLGCSFVNSIQEKTIFFGFPNSSNNL